MPPTPPPANAPTPAPQHFKDALAEIVRVGVGVLQMIGHVAAAETALAQAAARPGATNDASAAATSLAEAIEADRAFAAAVEARKTVVDRTESVAAAYNQAARALRRTVLLAEKLDRGWARPNGADNRPAKDRRHIERGVADAIAYHTEATAPDRETTAERVERVERLGEALEERLDTLDTLDELGNQPAEVIIADICRDLGIDPANLPGLPAPRSRTAAANARASPPDG